MTSNRIRLAAVGLFACVPLVLSACGSDEPEGGTGSGTDTGSSETTSGGAAEGTDDGTTTEATITIKDFAYGDPLTVEPSTEVTVVNEDSAPHNANDADGAFEQDLLQQGESATFTAPSEEGTYNLICTEHPQMAGELIVAG